MKYPLNVRERIGLAVVAAIVAADLCWVMCTRRSQPEPATPTTAVQVISEPQDTLASKGHTVAPKSDSDISSSTSAASKGAAHRSKSASSSKKKSSGKKHSSAPTSPPPPSRQWTEEHIPSSRP